MRHGRDMYQMIRSDPIRFQLAEFSWLVFLFTSTEDTATVETNIYNTLHAVHSLRVVLWTTIRDHLKQQQQQEENSSLLTLGQGAGGGRQALYIHASVHALIDPSIHLLFCPLAYDWQSSLATTIHTNHFTPGEKHFFPVAIHTYICVSSNCSSFLLLSLLNL